jgi:flagellar basal body-associated protein FliL
MKRKSKLIIAILVTILALLLVIIAGQIFFTHTGDLSQGEKKILICAVDESEKRPGMGSIDMAYIIYYE